MKAAQPSLTGFGSEMNPPLPSRPEMERAFLSSDASYNGVFYTAVRTTGIFCLPSCPARKPLPQNVEFFPTVKEAMFAGYRACKRCKPTEDSAPEWARDLLARIEANPGERITEGTLIGQGLDPGKVRRHFLKAFGMTFQAYCRARRLGYAFETLREGKSIDDAVFDSGFDSHSGFRTAFAKVFGAAPGQAKDQAQATECVRLMWLETPIGPMIAGASDQGVCLLEFCDRRMLEAQLTRVRKLFGPALIPGENAMLQQLRAELAEYFAGTRTAFDVPLVFPGTPFESRVWQELLKIPYGEIRSYDALAHAVGNPGASRAVGRANGMNRIAILIPCHRVLNKNGELSGYGGGLWRKRLLLNLEQKQTATGPAAGQEHPA